MRQVVFLVDMNAFFISCEMSRNPSLVGKPAAVAGDPKRRSGIILAANYDARKFGVKTAMVLHQAMRLCPNMALVPPDHHFYNKKSEQVMEVLSRYSPTVEQNSIDEAWLNMTGSESLFGKPRSAATQIMQEIQHDLGLWCSIGIAENKFLAKMASDMKKPLGITELWKKDIPDKLWPLPVNRMYGIGSKTAQKLNGVGIKTIGNLAKFDKVQLIKLLGKYGNDIHLLSNGYDDSPVTPHNADDMKSIGRSTTLPENIVDMAKAKVILMELADEIGMTARKYNKKARTIQITLKDSNFKVITRQTTVTATYATKDIYETAIDLLEKNWRGYPVRLIGLAISGFDEDCITEQLSLFDYTEVKDENTKHDKIDMAMDKIRNRHGLDKISRGLQIKEYPSE